MNKFSLFVSFLFFANTCLAQENVSVTTSVGFRDSVGLLYSTFISADSISKTLFTLASPEMEGRETGRPGQKLAARFLAAEYARKNLTGLGTPASSADSFLQKHPISLRNNKGRNLSVNGENYLYGKDFVYYLPESDTAIFIYKLLFIASRVNIANTVASDRYSTKSLLLFDSEDLYERLSAIEKAPLPTAVFVITDKSRIASLFTNGFSEPPLPFPVIYVTEPVAQNMVEKELFEKLKQKAGRKNKIIIREIDCTVSAGLAARQEELCGDNVVALLPGTSPDHEAIIISSHYDHLGKTDSSIYFGADDNASGTSAIVELARVFTQAANDGFKPLRDIIFLNVSGEEKGLLGSAWFVANPPLPLEKIVTDINIDMIGRTDSIHDSTGVHDYVYVIGADRLSSELHTINEEQNKKSVNLLLDYKYNSEDDPNNFYRRSDHYNFARKGIPVIFYFDGKHADYHQTTDVPEKIDLNLLTRRAQLVFLTAWELANRDRRIVVDKK